MIKAFWRRNNIYFYVSVLSIGFTLLFLSYQQAFDPDGVLYLNGAKAFLQQGLAGAMAVYAWPFYSILIAVTSSILHISLLHGAFVLNAILDTVIVIAFIVFIKALGGSRKLQWLGAFIILTYSFLSKFRYQVFRDHGYYAFGLLALLFLLSFCRDKKWRYAIFWGTAIVIATLFRVEGAAFVCFLPLILVFEPKVTFGSRIVNVAKAYTVQIILLVGMIIFKLVPHGVVYSHKATRLKYILQQLTGGVQQAINTLHTNANILAKVLFTYVPSYAHTKEVFLISGVIGMCIAVLVVTMRFWYFLLSIYAISKKLIPLDWSAHAVWFGAIILNIGVILVFALQHYFVVTRYVAFLAFLLLLAVPFAIEHIYTSWKTRSKTLVGSRWLFPLLVIAIIYTVLGGVYHFGTSKTYMVKAGNWLNRNTSAQARFLSNDTVVMYYADRTARNIDDPHNKLTCQQSLSLYDYVVVDVDRHAEDQEQMLTTCMRSEPIQTFQNRKGDKVLIFKLK